MKKGILKYLARFGLVLLISVPIIVSTQGEQAVKLVGYKASLIAIAIGLAELVWSVFFRPHFGRSENIDKEKLFPILVFRGCLYAAIVLGFTLGL